MGLTSFAWSEGKERKTERMICPYCLRMTGREKQCPWCFAEEIRQIAEERQKSDGMRRKTESGQIRKKVLPPGTRLHERYRLGRWIGHGGFGIMYRAMDEHLERMVAVKEFFPWKYTQRAKDGRRLVLPREEDIFEQEVRRKEEQTGTQGAFSGAIKPVRPRMSKTKREELQTLRAHFLEEARIQTIASTVSEVPKVFEVFEENNSAYLVMEFVEGMLLSSWMKRCRHMEKRQAVQVIRELLEAIERLHEYGIVHGDLGPDNLVLTGNRQLKILDFGSARRIENHAISIVGGKEHSGPVMPVTVKTGFAPPEQYRRECETDVRMDIYAIGALLSYLLTGIRPDSPLVRKKAEEKTGAFRMERKEKQNGISGICAKAMALEPEERFESALEMKRALEKAAPYVVRRSGQKGAVNWRF